jgi:hypothetical protein
MAADLADRLEALSLNSGWVEQPLMQAEEWPCVTKAHSADGKYEGWVLHGPGASAQLGSRVFAVDVTGTLCIHPPLPFGDGILFSRFFNSHLLLSGGILLQTLAHGVYLVARDTDMARVL